MKQYTILLPNGTQFGPMAESVIRRDLRTGRYPQGTLVWAEGMEEWKPLEEVLTASPRPVIPERHSAGEQAEEAVGSFLGTLRYSFTNWQYSGRITRRVFWRAALMQLAVFFLLDFVLMELALCSGGATGAFFLMLSVKIIPLCIMLALLPLFCRRLHDAGYSGKFLFLYFLGPIGLLVLCVMACLDSQYGNEYGPSVKYPD